MLKDLKQDLAEVLLFLLILKDSFKSGKISLGFQS